MPKVATLLFSVLLTGSLSACGSLGQDVESKESIPAVESESVMPAENMETSEKESIQQPGEVAESSNILIVYFSRYGNTEYPDDADATTSASIVIDENERYGTTEYVANLIQKSVGGDMHRIETVTPYTMDFDELRDVNHEEMEQNLMPELKESNLDVSNYDTIFIGYPVWATSVPQAVLSFLQDYDLTGKTVIPFCTHDGYGEGRSRSSGYHS